MRLKLRAAKRIIPIILIIFSYNLNAQHNVNREMIRDFQVSRTKKMLIIPNIPGYFTLKGDFHTHTMLSDGSVMPDFRVTEAWAEGLDIISITDHIEHRPNKNILPDDLNLGYNLALSKAEELNILLIPGTEISKKMPNPGHFNALFVKDVNKLTNDDPMLQIEEAINQGAVIVWNHPGSSWIRPILDSTIFWEFHTELLAKGWLHGIEVFNTDEWFPIALDWCIAKDLTIFSSSDIHTPINYWYDLSKSTNHRAMTLVFAKIRSEEAVKEALLEKRTIGFFGSTLVGKDSLIIELFNASVKLSNPFRQTNRDGKTIFYAELENRTDLTFILKKEGSWKNNDRTDILELLPRSSSIISYSEGNEYLEFQLTNCFSGGNIHPAIKIHVVN